MAGLRMLDGFSTTIDMLGNNDTIATAPGIRFFEKSVKLPGLEGGDMIDTTSMRNIRWRTKVPKQLISMKTMTCKVSYRCDVYDNDYFETFLNKIQGLRVNLPTGAQYGFWGALTDFEPDENKEGEEPQATVTFGCTNQRHVPDGDADPNDVERDPVYLDPTEAGAGDIELSDLDP